MTDENAPVEQVSNEGNSQQQVNWEARYKGQVKKIEELVTANRDLNTQLEARASEMEQLRAELGLKDTEKNAAVSQRDKQLQDVVSAKTQMESEIAELRAMKLKMEVAKELGQPELAEILDSIPNMTDKEALTQVMKTIGDFTQKAVQKREKDLLAGITPGISPVQQANPAAPTSDKGWMEQINSLQLGSKERAQAMEQYWVWAEAQHK